MGLRYRIASWKNSRPGMDFWLVCDKERSVSARRMSTCLRRFLQYPAKLHFANENPEAQRGKVLQLLMSRVGRNRSQVFGA